MAKGDSGIQNGDAAATTNVVLQKGGTAATTNVVLCMRALERAIHRPAHLPGMVGFYGDSGLGKSAGAAFAATKYRAYYIECRNSWTRKAFLEHLLQEMRVKPAKTIATMADQAAEQLALSRRPLIIDEADACVDHGYIEVIRDLHEGAGGAPILLIGEEALEVKLRPFERFHNRMLDWVPAQPASFMDTQQLCQMYCNGITVAEDLLAHIHDVSRSVTRRICINLSKVTEEASITPPEDNIATLAWWNNRPLSTGEAKRGDRR